MGHSRTLGGATRSVPLAKIATRRGRGRATPPSLVCTPPWCSPCPSCLVIASLLQSLRALRVPVGRSTTVVGLDLGTATIKLVVAQHQQRTVRITKMVAFPTPAGTVSSHGITDAGRLAATLREAWATHELPAHTVLVACLGGRDVVLERILVENGPTAEIDAQVQARAVNDVPFDPDDTLYSYMPLRTPAAEAQVPVLLVGVHNAQAQAMKSMLGKLAPLTTLKRLDVQVAALYNAFTRTMPGVRGPALFAHLGDQSTTALLLDEDGRLLSARDLPRGFRGLRDALVQQGAARDVADTALRTVGGMDSHPDVLQAWVHDLASDVQLLWRAAGLSGLQRPLFLTGGGSLSPDVVSALTEALHASGTECVDPVSALQIPFAAIDASLSRASAGPLCMVALGLALRDDALLTPARRAAKKGR